MRHLTVMLSFIVLSMSAALAQGTPGSPPATAPTETGQTGGIADYWWIILLVIVVISAIWYFSSRRTRV